MGIKQIDLKHCIKETYFDYFYKQCESNPLKKCLISISTNDFLSYKQTNDLSNKIAHFLLSSLKVKQNSVIGILMERSAKIPLAMIGINKAKCGFLIIDKKTPIKRMEFMLENSNVKNVITDSFTKDELKIKSINIIPFDKILNFSKNYPLPKILPNDILCHSYTSGTTGMPKCIIQKHVALKNVADAYANRLVPANIVENTIYGVFPPISFVVFLTDILCSIALGFEVHILSLSEQSSYVNLITYINDNKLTHCFVPPSLLNVFIERYNGDSLKLVLTGGDTVFINAKPKFDILVGYGLSEALSVMLYKFITPDSHITSVSYDGIIDGNLLYLVNEKNQVINQIGEIGEICISGPKVSVGYQNLPNENKKVFVNNP
jgi:non-ribosomal peptide synthetase component F